MVTTVAPAPATARPLRAELRPVLACIAAGVVGGILVGGIGGRLAMLLLRLTSTDAVRGLDTDDGFRIGEITLVGTLFFVFFMGTTGAVAGGLYAAVRPFVPRGRVAVAAVVGGLVGGSAIVHPGGLDFRFLDPLPLAIAMFVAIPAAGAAAIAALADRWADGERWGGNRLLAGLSLVPAIPALASPPVLVGGIVLIGASVAARRSGLADDRRVQAAVVAVLAVVSALAAVQLAGDVAEIL